MASDRRRSAEAALVRGLRQRCVRSCPGGAAVCRRARDAIGALRARRPAAPARRGMEIHRPARRCARTAPLGRETRRRSRRRHASALGRVAHIDAHRACVRRWPLSARSFELRARRVSKARRSSAMLPTRRTRWPAGLIASPAPTSDAADCAQHGVHDATAPSFALPSGASSTSRCLRVYVRAGAGPLSSRAQRHDRRRGRRATIIEAHVALPASAPAPDQRAHRSDGRRQARPSRTSRSRSDVGESAHLANWLVTPRRRRQSYRGFQYTRARGCAQPDLAPSTTARAASSIFPARTSCAAASTSTRRWSSITRCRTATSRELFKGVLDGAGARRVPGQDHRAPGRAEDRRQADGAGADAVAGRRVR